MHIARIVRRPAPLTTRGESAASHCGLNRSQCEVCLFVRARAIGTSAQIARDLPQIAGILGLRPTAAGGAPFRLGIRASLPLRCPPARSCHAGGRGFESRRSRSPVPPATAAVSSWSRRKLPARLGSRLDVAGAHWCPFGGTQDTGQPGSRSLPGDIGVDAQGHPRVPVPHLRRRDGRMPAEFRAQRGVGATERVEGDPVGQPRPALAGERFVGALDRRVEHSAFGRCFAPAAGRDSGPGRRNPRAGSNASRSCAREGAGPARARARTHWLRRRPSSRRSRTASRREGRRPATAGGSAPRPAALPP